MDVARTADHAAPRMKTGAYRSAAAVARPRGLRIVSRRPRAQCGIALMEALISILIFSFGLLGLIGLEARAINFSVDAENRNRAALLANEVATNMWMAGSVALSPAALATLQATAAGSAQEGLPNGTLNVAPVGGTTNSADITITWMPPSQSATSTLTTRVTLP